MNIATVVGVLLAVSGTPRAITASLTAKYGGLGATASAFYAQNPHGQSPPSLGLFNYTIARTRAGRVTAYRAEVNARPRFSSRERIVLMLDGINLPRDATITHLNSNTCIVWRSATLKKLIGMAYAAGTTRPGTTTAQMRAERTPQC